jgi:hypothetical protein
VRVLPSSRPCNSRYSNPLAHAIQVSEKTTANSKSPFAETWAAG